MTPGCCIRTLTLLQVTTNDILMAICACAVAPFRTHDLRWSTARISLMVDARGRGRPLDFFGNAAVPMDVHVAWDTLLSFDLSQVAREIHASMSHHMNDVAATCTMDPGPPPEQPSILMWNSWARAVGLLEVWFASVPPPPPFLLVT